MPFVERGLHRIHYETHGAADAPPLLLVMGLGLSSTAWDTLPDKLAARFRVITFDNRGTGDSTLAGAFFGVHDMADDAAAVLDAAGAPSASVFGISMGGMTALELVLRHRRRVRSLALGCTFAGYLRSTKPAPAAAFEFMHVVGASGRNVRERMAKLLVSPEYYAREPEHFDRWLSRIGHGRLGTTLQQVAAVMRHSTEARLRDIDVPTLVITGDADRLVPADNSRHLAARIPRAKLVELAGAGHCFPVEREDETVRALVDHFLQGAIEARI